MNLDRPEVLESIHAPEFVYRTHLYSLLDRAEQAEKRRAKMVANGVGGSQDSRA